MTGNEKKHITEIGMYLFNLSCELDQISSRARLLEDNIDEIRYKLIDLCENINSEEEEEDAE